MKILSTLFLFLLGTASLASCTLIIPVEEPPQTCGNGTIDPWEECEPENVGDESCISQGFGGGTLACTHDCRFDTSNCDNTFQCGDNDVNDTEECDGSNLNGKTCKSLGFPGGDLSCTDSCTFDTTDCESASQCGDEMIAADEECEGDEMTGGYDIGNCVDWGFCWGETPMCSEECTLDFTACEPCSDTQVVGMECDSQDNCFGFQDTNQPQCTDFGFLTSSICTADCNPAGPDACVGVGGECAVIAGDGYCIIPCDNPGQPCDEGVGDGTFTCIEDPSSGTAFCAPGAAECECLNNQLLDGSSLGTCDEWGFLPTQEPVECIEDCYLDFSNCEYAKEESGTGVGMLCGATPCEGFAPGTSPQCSDFSGVFNQAICSMECNADEGPDICVGAGGKCIDAGGGLHYCGVPCTTQGALCPAEVGDGTFTCDYLFGASLICLPPVDLCGNTTVDSGEECDNGSLPSGDSIGTCAQWGFEDNGASPQCTDCALDFANCTPSNPTGMTGVGMICTAGDPVNRDGFSDPDQVICHTMAWPMNTPPICTQDCSTDGPDVCTGAGGVCVDLQLGNSICLIPCDNPGSTCAPVNGFTDYVCTDLMGQSVCLPPPTKK